MNKRTKIVATLGPATDRPEVLESMIRSGVDVVRINFSHGSGDDHRRRVARIREAAARVGKDIGILGDLQGPKIRIERFAEGPVELEEGHRFALDTSLGPNEGTVASVGVTYKDLPGDLEAGDPDRPFFEIGIFARFVLGGGRRLVHRRAFSEHDDVDAPVPGAGVKRKASVLRARNTCITV